MESRELKFIITGGGTGGHIFPAIAIADALKRRFPSSKILFIGAEGRMEMERVPKAGYPIKALPVLGLDRKHLLRNFKVIFKFFKAIKLAKRYTFDFAPHFVIGVGGYASAPTVLTAQNLGIPTLIQEQNSYAGVANKKLAARAKAICVAYEGMERFFPKERIVLTGNPIRHEIEQIPLPPRAMSLQKFQFCNTSAPTIVAVGGSLGAKTINESLESKIKQIAQSQINLLWQTGKSFYARALDALKILSNEEQKYITIVPFIDDMAAAYSVADLLISRAGASTISEIQSLGKASILVPSPNVAEDHQTHNARALADRGAAVMVTDSEARERLVSEAIELVQNLDKCKAMAEQVYAMRLPNSADYIVNIIEGLLKNEA